MQLQPNSQLRYKDGKRRITIWMHGQDEETGLILFNVNIKQASKSFSGGTAYVHPDTFQVTEIRDGGMQHYINAAIAAFQDEHLTKEQVS